VNVALFYHSALSDWNHGNAHFLRGVAVELQSRGHGVVVYEPADAWSVTSLIEDHGEQALEAARRAFPSLRLVRYDEGLDVARALDGVDLVIVHEWNSPDLVRRIGLHHRRNGGYTLLFHDTHHRSISDAQVMATYDLADYDGVLAFGDIIRERYVAHGWTARAWTWHEAADVRLFKPHPEITPHADLVWVGNWGDGERSDELREFLIRPVVTLGLDATIHGVRYPSSALAELQAAGIRYAGWLPNYRVPMAFASHRVTVHVPRRPYVEHLHGIPTIRPFEALACGIPLVSAPWYDAEGLFREGDDYLVARDGEEMQRHLRAVLEDEDLAEHLSRHGRETILARHTCAHRVDELLAILHSIAPVVAV
jgi:spore maturation protein CgeB